MSAQIRVLLADDQAMVRGALATLLGLEPDIAVVAQVGRGDEVFAAALAHHPDVCILDIEMPGMNGIDATAAVTAALPETKVLIVTTFGRPGYLRRALDAGATGFVVKDTPAPELADAVRAVARGQRTLDAALATQSLVDGDNPLTERERDVLRVALTGAAVAGIAGQLFLSHGTVRNYLSSAIGKTATSTRYEAARIAQERGWI